MPPEDYPKASGALALLYKHSQPQLVYWFFLLFCLLFFSSGIDV